MSGERVIQADFANWRPVAGRKVLQLIMEIPIEQTEAAIKMLGVPMPGESKWVAIALLKPSQAPPSSSEAKPSGSPKKFHELPLPQQAAIRCGDVLFQEYLKLENEIAATDYVRLYCGVESRSQIRIDYPSGARWRELDAKYQAWATDRKFAVAKR